MSTLKHPLLIEALLTSNSLDIPRKNSSNTSKSVATCNDNKPPNVATAAGGLQAMMAPKHNGNIPDDILAVCLEPLLHYPLLISYYDEDIAGELVQRDYFSPLNGEVTAAGRDFLGSQRVA